MDAQLLIEIQVPHYMVYGMKLQAGINLLQPVMVYVVRKFQISISNYYYIFFVILYIQK